MGTQTDETTKVAAANRSGPVAPKPRPATARTITPTCVRQFRRKSPRRCGGLRQRRRITAEEQAGGEKWGKTAEESRWLWAEYQRRWPPQERALVRRPDDAPGSWRGEGNRTLKPEANGRVEAACDQIADREREKISPALRAIESQDPDRHLIGFEHRLKGRDRIKDKVCRSIRNFGRTPEQAVSRVPDTIRYTFEYREARYTQGVWTDVGRLKEQGFELHRYGSCSSL